MRSIFQEDIKHIIDGDRKIVILRKKGVLISYENPPPASAIYLDILEVDRSTFSINYGDQLCKFLFRSRNKLTDFLKEFSNCVFIIESREIEMEVWALIVKILLENNISIYFCYSPPERYIDVISSTDYERYDITESGTVGEVPGFEVLSGGAGKSLAIALLGFESKRTRYMLNEAAADNQAVYPLISLPPLRLEYLQIAYYQNRDILLENRNWTRAKAVSAYCPYSTFKRIDRIYNENLEYSIQIALSGSKIMNLGAVLFALYKIKSKQRVEILYDFPRERSRRIAGGSSIMLLNVSRIWEVINRNA